MSVNIKNTPIGTPQNLNSGFSYLKKFTIDNTLVAADLTDYECFVPLNDADMNSNANDDFTDVRFVDANNTQIPHDIRYRKILSHEGETWTWFNRPAALYHSGTAEQTYFGGVAGGPDGTDGEIRINAYNHATGALTSLALSTQEDDDHNNPAIYVRTDGKVLCCYARHGQDVTLRYRISSSAEDITAFAVEQTITTVSGNVTYAQLAYMPTSGRLFWWFRMNNIDGSNRRGWGYVYSDDEGDTWTTPEIKVMHNSERAANENMYIQLSTSGDRIDFLCSDGFPNLHSDVTIGHFYAICDGAGDLTYYNSAGVDQGSPLFSANIATVIDPPGDMPRKWIWDVSLTSNNVPVVAFQRALNDATTTTAPTAEYVTARYENGVWTTSTVVSPGETIYISGSKNAQPGYFPGICFDVTDADRRKLFVARSPAQDIDYFNVEVWSQTNNTWNLAKAITDVSAEIPSAPGRLDNYRPVSPWGTPAGKRLKVIWISKRYDSFGASVSAFNGAHVGWPYPVPQAIVKLDVSGSVDTVFYAQYGNSATSDHRDPTSVWSNYHLATWFEWEPGSNVVDSRNDLNATIANNVWNVGTRSDNAWGTGIEPTATENLEIDDGSSLIDSTGFSIEAVAIADTGLGANNTILSNWAAPADHTKAHILFRLESGLHLTFFVARKTNQQTGKDFTGVTVTLDQLTHLVGSFDTTDMECYINGVASGTPQLTGTAIEDGVPSNLFAVGDSPHDVSPFDGAIFFVGLHKTRMSANLITTRSNNSLNASFITKSEQFTYK